MLIHQAEGEEQMEKYEQLPNDTYSWDEGDSFAPCELIVPGFNSLGLLIVYMIVFVISLMGNSVVVYVVCSMRKTTTEVYLLHLALADLLFCLTLPFWAVDVHYGWIFGGFLCKLLSGFQEASVYSGVFLLACISVDRYFAIVRATRVSSSHHLQVRVICGVVWLVAVGLSLPAMIKRESMYDDDLGQYICYDNVTAKSSDHWRVSVRILQHSVGFFLPLLVMAVCYGWTVATLFQTRNQQKHKAMCVILAVVLAFILCWLPYNVTILIDTLMRREWLCETQYVVEMVLNVTKLVAFMHCAVNPVLYAFIGEKFRRQLALALSKCGLCQRFQAASRRSSAGSVRSRNSSVLV
ncbi:C-X-C chemokine receptor type 2-like [Salarias fasciatus]|uniref:C-X-C chemokine receptor type 2-like n=1 Tax=Salarias fasciatus TaxID=181472 RepID=A0A672ID20_SALFA|nr:C-X-C chemokine receptor type 2-like [Salarias fasciatus]